MKILDKYDVKLYLKQNHIVEPNMIRDIIDCFDFTKKVYEQHLFPRDLIYQFVRNPSFFNLSPAVGNFFTLKGATLDGVAIISGAAGRQLMKFSVELPIVALEGSASKQSRNWEWDGGGAGGSTQIYIPPNSINRLKCLGSV